MRIRSLARAAVVAITAFALMTGVASAYSVEFDQLIFDENGDPALNAGTQPDGRGGYSWQICRPNEACQPIAAKEYPSYLTPGETPAGTTFIVTAQFGSAIATATSKPWLGRPALLSPPHFAVAPAVGQRMRPASGVWSGGWGDEYDVKGVEACRTPQATSCETVWAPDEDYSHRSSILGPYYAGWYLFATDSHYASDTAFVGGGYSSADAVPVFKPSLTDVLSAPVGPLAADNKLRGSTPRRATIRRHGTITIANVFCARRCRVDYAASYFHGRASGGDQDSFFVKGHAAIRARFSHLPSRVTIGSHVWINNGLATHGSTRAAKR